MDKEVFIGIDLGTSYTSASLLRPQKKGEIEDVVWKNGTRSIPSKVNYGGNHPAVGFVSGTHYVVSNAKRLIGKRESEIKKEAYNSMFGGEVVETDDGFLGIRLTGGESNSKAITVKPYEVERDILKSIMEKIYDEQELKPSDIIGVTIGVPAKFGHYEREETLKAAKEAGLTNVTLLNEPTAAALAYHMGKNLGDGYYLIYDLGGGTFDTTLISCKKKDKLVEYIVLGSDGDPNLGGTDFDSCVVRLLKKKIMEKIFGDKEQQYYIKMAKSKRETNHFSKAEYTNPFSDSAKTILYEKAIKIKEHFNETTEEQLIDVSDAFKAMGFRVNDEDFEDDEEDNPNNVIISRNEFEAWIRPYINQSIKIIEKVITNTKKPSGDRFQIHDITAVILVGGSSRLYFIPTMLQEYFHFPNHMIKSDIDPDLGVSNGCCLYGSIQSNVSVLHLGQIAVSDISSYSYGIGITDGRTYPLIRKGEKIPTKVTKMFTTTEDYQETINTAAYYGDSELTKDNTLIQNIQFSPVSRQLKGIPRIEITYDIQSSNLLVISCHEIFPGGMRKPLGEQKLELSH